jgi:hypothetical protein
MATKLTPRMRAVLQELAVSDQTLIRMTLFWRKGASYHFRLTTSKHINMDTMLFNRLLEAGLIVCVDTLPHSQVYTISTAGMEALDAAEGRL